MMESSLQRKYFDEILLGKKVYELRVNDEKRRKIKVGDIIKFLCENDPYEHMYVNVSECKVYDSFESAIDDININKLLPGYNRDEALEIYYNFPKYREMSKKHGVVCLKLNRLYFNDFIN